MNDTIAETKAREQCPRCKDWERMGLSSYCPSCDAAWLESQESTPPYLRQMPEETVKHFVDRTEALFDAIALLGREDLLFTAMTMRGEAMQFNEPWERTPWMAMRLVKVLMRMTSCLTAASEQQLAGIASGLAADIEGAVTKTTGE